MLDEIKKLEYDWDGCGAVKVSDNVIEFAENVISELGEYTKCIFDIYAHNHGTIVINFESDDDNMVEIEIGSNYMGLIFARNGYETEGLDTCTVHDIKERLDFLFIL